MIKKIGFILSLVVIGIITISFTKQKVTSNPKPPVGLFYTVGLAPDFKDNYNALDLGNSYHAFKEALGYKESRGNYFAVNTYGYKGKYQFGGAALRSVGVSDAWTFLRSPKMQEQAFIALLSKHKWVLRDYIDSYEGKTINGIDITESGILAAAHLGGAGNVKKFLRSNGSARFRDGYGTSISIYFKRFGGYDMSFIKADINAKVSM
jgi:hypothetical protein